MKTLLPVLFIFVTLCCASGTIPDTDTSDDSAPAATDLERIQIGTLAPDFTLESLDGAQATLSDYRETKNIILIFYRGYW